MGSIVGGELTRGELVALKETIEKTPTFDGRAQARQAISGLLRQRPDSRSRLSLDEQTVAALARNVVVPVDVTSVAIHNKLSRAIDSTH
jgi:hypothetical protein